MLKFNKSFMELCGAIYLCVILNFPFYYVSSQRDPYTTTSFRKREFNMEIGFEQIFKSKYYIKR